MHSEYVNEEDIIIWLLFLIDNIFEELWENFQQTVGEQQVHPFWLTRLINVFTSYAILQNIDNVIRHFTSTIISTLP